MTLTNEIVEGQTAASYSVCNCQLKLLSFHHNSSLRYLHIMPALALSITHAHTYLQDRAGRQVIRSSDQVIKQLSGSSVCGVNSGSRFDQQKLCGSGVMSRVELLAPRVYLYGNTSLSSSQRVYFSSFLSVSPPLSSLSLPSLSLLSPSLPLLTC